MIKYLFTNKVKSIFFLILAILNGITDVYTAYLIGDVVQIASSNSWDKFKSVAIFVFCALIIFFIVNVLQVKLFYNVRKNAIVALRNDVFTSIMRKNIVDFEKENVSAYINDLTEKVNSLEMSYFDNILLCPMIVTIFIFSIITIIIQRLWLIIPVMFFSLLSVILIKLFNKNLLNRSKNKLESSENYTFILKEYLEGFQLIKIANLFSYVSKTHKKYCNEAAVKKNLNDDAIQIVGTIAQGIGIISKFIVLILAAKLSLSGIISIGSVVLVSQVVPKIAFPLNFFSNLLTSFKTSKPSIEVLDRILTYKEDNSIKQEIISFNRDIEIKGLSFAYEKGKQNILKDVNFIFEKGKKYAIVGASVCGKSTLIKLLLGYYDKYDGQIKIDGQSIAQISNSSLYNIIGTTPQSTFIFEDTLKNNITLYNSYSEVEIQNAIDASELNDLINKLPNKLESIVVGNGNNISGGEKQRISLARVILKNYPILLLDESTSAMDMETSYIVENNILSLDDKTIISITHKLKEELLSKYDSILVFKKGRLVETGDFYTLMKKNGYFYILYNYMNSNKIVD